MHDKRMENFHEKQNAYYIIVWLVCVCVVLCSACLLASENIQKRRHYDDEATHIAGHVIDVSHRDRVSL